MKDYNGLKYTRTFQVEKYNLIRQTAFIDKVYSIAHNLFYLCVFLLTSMFSILVLF